MRSFPFAFFPVAVQCFPAVPHDRDCDGAQAEGLAERSGNRECDRFLLLFLIRVPIEGSFFSGTPYITEEETVMDQKIYQAYVDILREELIPATGCTEPIPVAYAGALASAPTMQ